MKIVVLDGYTLNPGDISWEGLERMKPESPLPYYGSGGTTANTAEVEI